MFLFILFILAKNGSSILGNGHENSVGNCSEIFLRESRRNGSQSDCDILTGADKGSKEEAATEPIKSPTVTGDSPDESGSSVLGLFNGEFEIYTSLIIAMGSLIFITYSVYRCVYCVQRVCNNNMNHNQNIEDQSDIGLETY